MRKHTEGTVRLVNTLVKTLSGLGLHRSTSIAELLAFDGPADPRRTVSATFATDVTLLVQSHHEIEPAIMVYDPFLGTIGLIELIDTPEYRTDLEAAIERAAYLRQLALLEAAQSRRRALTVELVVAFAKECHAEGGQQAGAILRNIAAGTGYLETIGVGLLQELADGSLPPSRVRAAFPWLLADTRRWYSRHTAAAAERNTWALELENYRQAGRRLYSMNDTGLLLLHGYNGTGKSSFTEALELLLTGRIDRLELAQQTTYFPVVRYRGSNPGELATTAASVRLNVGTTPRVSVTIPPEPPEGKRDHEPVWSDGRKDAPLGFAGSFRLDQPTMDTLVRSSESDRASVFLRSFFPQERPLFDRLDAAKSSADAMFDSVKNVGADSTAPEANTRDAVRKRLWWAAIPVAEWKPETLQACLASCVPVTPSQIRILSHFSAPVADAYGQLTLPISSADDLEAAFKKLDRAIEGAAVQTLQPRLGTARRVFEEFNDWTAVGGPSGSASFAATLNAWLELRALADLASRQYDVAATLLAAHERGWTPSPDVAAFLPAGTAAALDTLRARRDKLVDDRGLALGAVRQWTQPPSDGSAAASTKARRFELTDKEVDSLNAAGRWLPCAHSEGTPVALGDLFRTAITRNTTSGVGSISLGVPGGLSTAIAEAIDLELACARLLPSHDPAATVFRNCLRFVTAHDEASNLGRTVEESFLSQIATENEDGRHPLNEALNELLALFKPAPWAYADIALRANVQGSRHLGIRVGEAKADLRLNTAELNSFTLALFMLCATRLENPLRLLVLDDPMQNMDEMTVSAIARGLGKLLAIVPHGWQIVALFHGEDDLRRVRDEVPCAVYRLPWLVPTEIDKELPINCKRDESTWDYVRQTLSEVVGAMSVPAG